MSQRKTAKNILFFNPDIYRTGGSNISLLKIIANIDRARFRPFMAIPDPNEYQRELDTLSVTILPFSTNLGWFPTSRHFNRHLASFRSRVETLTEMIQTNEINLVCTNSDNVFEAPLACVIAGVPHVWRMNGAFDGKLDVFDHFPLTSGNQAYLMVELSEKIVCLSPSEHKKFASLAPLSKIELIEPIIEPPTLLTERSLARGWLREQIGVECARKKIVLNVGRVSPEKDLLTFCRTAKEIVTRLPQEDILFVHFGNVRDSAYHAELLDYVKQEDLAGRITFAGEIAPSDLAIAYRSADVFLFTSKRESFARSCAEAMIHGLPAVSTRCSGPADYIADGESGYLANIADVDALTTATCKLLTSPQLARSIGETGLSAISQNYDICRISKKWNRLFEDSIENFDTNNRVRKLAFQLIVNSLSGLGEAQARIDALERQVESLVSFRQMVTSNKLATAAKTIISKLRRIGSR